MASSKQISSSLTVTTVEDGKDGASDQQIYKLSSVYPWSGGTPSGGSGDNDVPTGWSRTVLGVSESNKYCYISSRSKTNGTWSAWSTPVLYTRWAEDGTSISIKGTANGVVAWGGSIPTASASYVGQIYLRNDNVSEDYSVCQSVAANTYAWVGKNADMNDSFLYQGDMWSKQRSIPASDRWNNLGRIQGPKGDDGDDGKTVRTTTVYTVSSSQPSRPTGSSLPPTGWLSTPPSVVGEVTTITGNFTNIVGGRQSVGNEVEDLWKRDILTFVTTEANQVIAIEIEADTENDFDYIYVGLLDTPVTSRPEDTASDLSYPERAASGGEKKVVLTTVDTADTHTLDIIFTKDSQDSFGSDTVKYRIVTDVWLSEAVMEDGVLTGQWSVPARWGAAVKRSYKLLPFPTSISFHRTALDTLTPASVPVYCGYKVIEDNKETSRAGIVVAFRRFIGPQLMRIFYRMQNQNGTFGSWNDHSAAQGNITIANTDYGIEFALSTSVTTSGVNDANIVDRVTIPVLKDGQKGEQGAAGVMYYPAGEYTDTVTYTKDDKSCPLVHYTGPNNVDAGYWYLNAQNNLDQNNQRTAPANTAGNPWQQAENYGMVITEALFAAFAKLGSFIVSGDFFISQYGTLFTSSSDSEGTPVNTMGQQYQSKACYTYFRSEDPMAEKPSVNTYPKFRPRKVVNALTGEEYMAEGNVRIENDDRGKTNVTIRGTIKADNLYQNMCLFSGGSSGVVYSSVTYYIKQKPTIGLVSGYDLNCATQAEVTVNTNFWNALHVNGYYTEEEITTLQEQYTASNITPYFIEHDEDGNNKYFWLQCTGLSNLVQMVPTVSGYGYDNDYPVKLPRAVDFPNKVIEVMGWSRVTDERQMYVGSVDDKMRIGIDVDFTQGKFVFANSPTAKITIITGAVYKFQSISLDNGSNYYWVCLGRASASN